MATTTNFVAAQAANRRNTLILLVVLTLFAAGFGYLIGWVLQSEATDEVPLVSQAGLVMASGLAVASVVWSLISLTYGSRLVVAMADAKEIAKDDAPQLFNVVEEMSIASGVPMPGVRVMETDALNAFATGTSTSNATIAVTRGLLNTLNRDELQGVIAHEMAHIANLDTRYMTIVGVTVGLIALIADMILRTMRWGGTRSSRNSNSDKKSSGAGLLIIVLVVVAIIAPIAAKAVQMAVSRQREYLADATSVQFTRNPSGLISALQKLAAAAAPFPGVSRATQHLFIVNPIKTFTAKSSALMATHPDVADRIARLRNLGA
ncbi:M48 family metallopeptidase [Reyranella sp.]|uniref:M48 family metallopeptidase n=1 Tax=Reyranella sp. TaxID=1929291 RepID=UPI003D0C57C8